MKTPHNTQEQKANQLWRRYKKPNEEKFWPKYEALVKKHKVVGEVSHP